MRLLPAIALFLVSCVSQQRQDKASTRADLGAAYLLEGNPRSAIPVLREATKLDKRNYAAWQKLGLAYMAAGAAEESEAAFLRALRLAPDDAEVNNNYATLLIKLGRLEEAVPVLEHAIEDLTYRKPAMVLSNLGLVQHQLGQHESAIKTLDEAVRRAPNLCKARYNRGLAWNGMERKGKALDDFEAVIQLCGSDAMGAYLQAGSILLTLDDRSGACTYLRTVISGAGESDLGDTASAMHARECT